MPWWTGAREPHPRPSDLLEPVDVHPAQPRLRTGEAAGTRAVHIHGGSLGDEHVLVRAVLVAAAHRRPSRWPERDHQRDEPAELESWRYDQPPPLKADDETAATTRGVEHAALTVRVDASNTSAFDTMWRECVGSGHAALWSRADWREHIRMVSTEIGFHYLRGHGILDNAVM